MRWLALVAVILSLVAVVLSAQAFIEARRIWQRYHDDDAHIDGGRDG